MLKLLALMLGCQLGGTPSEPAVPAVPAVPMPPPWPALSLDGAWLSEGVPLTLPLQHQQAPFAVERTLRLPEGWHPDEEALLRMDAAGWRVTAWVNGELADSATGGLAPLTLSLGSRLSAGANQLQLRLDPPTPANVIDGVDAQPLAQWTGNTPAPGRVMAQGSIALEFPREARVDALSTALEDGVLTVTARGSALDGAAVRFEVVRDGEVLARLPDAVMTGGVAESSAPWSGPIWSPGEPALQLLVARLEGGQGRQQRFGARELGRAEGALMINEREQYLAALRYEADKAPTRVGVHHQIQTMVQAGANTVELHGPAPDIVLQVADELGVMVVETPRCDGQIRVDGPLRKSESWVQHIESTARRSVEARDRHPSLVLRSLEGVFSELRMDAAYHAGAVPAVDARELRGLVEGELERAISEGLPPYIIELPWALDGSNRDLAGRLEPLLEAHRSDGLGLVLPQVNGVSRRSPLSPDERAEERAALALMLARHDVSTVALVGREGPATVRITARRAGAPAVGVPVVLRVPGQLPSGVFTDEQGKATIVVDYAGEATLETLDGETRAAVSLERGVYSARRWQTRAATVTLELTEAGGGG